jgi:hypothetical protein
MNSTFDPRVGMTAYDFDTPYGPISLYGR